MTHHRRAFLQTAAASAGVVAWSLHVPAFLRRAAAAAPDAGKPGARDTILVVVEFTGGNDGLNTLVPYKSEEYAKYRPTLKISAAEVKKIDDEVGLHPQMDGLAALLEHKALCVVQGVGYPNP